MSLDHVRIDDRLIHGQVVVGWGHPCGLGFLVLVDDEIAASEWERDLYEMAVPPGMAVYFDTVDSAVSRLPQYVSDTRAGMLLVKDIATMQRLVARAPAIKAVTLGGLHHQPGRTARLRYVFLTPVEERQLRELAATVQVTAQDLPNAHPVPLDKVLQGDGSA